MSSEAYRAAANSLFDKWQALSMAVEHSFGGEYSSQKAEWLRSVTCDFLTDHKSAPDAHDVEDFLSSLMDQEFDTIIEDGSLTEVSRQLVELWHKWKVKGEVSPPSRPSPLSDQTEQEMKEEIEREESVAEETVDAEEKMDDEDNGAGDGWTVVTRKR